MKGIVSILDGRLAGWLAGWLPGCLAAWLAGNSVAFSAYNDATSWFLNVGTHFALIITAVVEFWSKNTLVFIVFGCGGQICAYIYCRV